MASQWLSESIHTMVQPSPSRLLFSAASFFSPSLRLSVSPSLLLPLPSSFESRRHLPSDHRSGIPNILDREALPLRPFPHVPHSPQPILGRRGRGGGRGRGRGSSSVVYRPSRPPPVHSVLSILSASCPLLSSPSPPAQYAPCARINQKTYTRTLRRRRTATN